MLPVKFSVVVSFANPEICASSLGSGFPAFIKILPNKLALVVSVGVILYAACKDQLIKYVPLSKTVKVFGGAWMMEEDVIRSVSNTTKRGTWLSCSSFATPLVNAEATTSI